MGSYPSGPSGGPRVVYEYANRLVRRGHEVAVVHPRRLKQPSCERLTLSQWTRRNVLRPLRRSLSRPVVDWIPIEKRVRMLFVPNLDMENIPDGDAIFATAWQTANSVLEFPPTKGRKFYLIQGYETWQGPKDLVDATWRAPLRKVVVSKWLLELGKEMGCGDATYVPNGIDHTLYRVTRALKERPLQVAMMVSSEPVKGSSDGLDALRITRERFPDLRVVLFGTGRRQSWIPTWAEYYRNAEQDFIVKQIYNTSRILVSSSWSEGFAFPPAEAACCGCAVVATDSGGIREFIENGVTGLLSPVKDPGALAENLRLLIENDGLRIRLAEACSRVVARLSWEKSADLLADVIMRAN